MAAAAHDEAAVVRPSTCPIRDSRKISPAPRNPTPVITPAMTFSAEAGNSSTPSPVTAAAPTASNANVRSPADLPRYSRSKPIT